MIFQTNNSKTLNEFQAAKRLGIRLGQVQILTMKGKLARLSDGRYSENALTDYLVRVASLSPAEKRRELEPIRTEIDWEAMMRRKKESKSAAKNQTPAEREVVPDVRVSEMTTIEKTDFISKFGSEIFARALKFELNKGSMTRAELEQYRSERSEPVAVDQRKNESAAEQPDDPILKNLSSKEKSAYIREHGMAEFLRLLREQPV